jgi:hypothetical protein
MDVTSARTAVDAWLRALAAPVPPPARKAVPGPVAGRGTGRPYLRPARDQGLPPGPRTAEPDAAPPRRQSPYGHGPVDFAATLAPLLAPPGTVPLP